MRLSDGTAGERQQTGRVVLMVGGERVPLELTVPAAPGSVEALLSILRGLSRPFAERMTSQLGARACCRQLAPSEARALARLEDALPERAGR